TYLLQLARCMRKGRDMSLCRTSISAGVVAAVLCVPVARANPPAEIRIPGEKIYPESLTSDSRGTIYIGSIAKGVLSRVSPGAASAETWIKPTLAQKQGILGVFADVKSGTLWACASTPGAPGGPPPEQSEVHAFDLKTGASKGHYPLPTPNAFCNDIA